MLLLATAVIMSSVCFTQGASSGYYWRDFDGTVPPDAFQGGRDVNNKPVYIARVFDEFLIPAQIFLNDISAHYEWQKKDYAVQDHIKILCTGDPKKLEWIKTDNSGIKKIPSKSFVKGGYEKGYASYIGRARIGGEVLIGKALIEKVDTPGLHLTRKNKPHSFDSFEVLTFKP